MSTQLIVTFFTAVLYVCMALALAVSAVRLMWIAGSYLKQKMRQSG